MDGGLPTFQNIADEYEQIDSSTNKRWSTRFSQLKHEQTMALAEVEEKLSQAYQLLGVPGRIGDKKRTDKELQVLLIQKAAIIAEQAPRAQALVSEFTTHLSKVLRVDNKELTPAEWAAVIDGTIGASNKQTQP